MDTTNDSVTFNTYVPPAKGRCPTCGRCRDCHAPHPAPAVYPFVPYPYPYQQPWYTYTYVTC